MDLPKHLPKKKPEEIGLGRNVAVFEWLRQYAYKQVRHYKQDVRNFVLWQTHLNGKALERNGELHLPLAGNEVWHIAKSVSKWTWNRFDLAASDARFVALQAHRGRLGCVAFGAARFAASEDKRTSARLMAAEGRGVREIAKELGVGKSTVARWVSVP
ncbi:MAG: primase C-terminal domain-containing protein [Comamonas sp.]|nr:primase C-terminal domain-containing protein [Comamonas sp.]